MGINWAPIHMPVRDVFCEFDAKHFMWPRAPLLLSHPWTTEWLKYCSVLMGFLEYNCARKGIVLAITRFIANDDKGQGVRRSNIALDNYNKNRILDIYKIYKGISSTYMPAILYNF